MCRIRENIDIPRKITDVLVGRKKFNPGIMDASEIYASALYGLFVADRAWTEEKEKVCLFRTFASKRIRYQILDDYRERVPGKRRQGDEIKPSLVSLDAGDETGSPRDCTFVDFLESGHDVEHQVHLSEIKPAILSSIQKMLTSRQVVVVALYYFGGLDQKEISELFGVSKGRISQLHRKALGRLRESGKLRAIYKEMDRYQLQN